jgi:chloride channel protein, CIC family
VTLSYASGNAGGIFGPSLFIGAMLGGTVGSVAHHFAPAHTAVPGAYALVGMGAAFAGIVRTPMTSVMMIFEVTRDYAIIVPLMISNLVSFFISRWLQPQPIYEALARQDGIHLPTAENGEREDRYRVGQAMQPVAKTLAEDMLVAEALENMRHSEFRTWPVGTLQRVVGVVTAARLQQLSDEGAGNHKMQDIMGPQKFPHVHTDQSLHFALQRMGEAELDLLPVVARADVHELLGVVVLRDILKEYGIG